VRVSNPSEYAVIKKRMANPIKHAMAKKDLILTLKRKVFKRTPTKDLASYITGTGESDILSGDEERHAK